MRWTVALLVCLQLAIPARAADTDAVSDPDGYVLRRNKIEHTSAALIEHVRRACGKDVSTTEVVAEVAKLGDRRFAVREQASKSLAEFGAIAVPSLRRALHGEDAETVQRVRQLLGRITAAHSSATLAPAIHVLLWNNDATAVEPLLKVLPFIVDSELEADIWHGLDRLVGNDSKRLAVVAGYLADTSPARRAFAANLIARRGETEGRAKVAGLLADPDSFLRLRAAAGLIAVGDKRGVGPLIDLIADNEPLIRWQSLDLLRWLADAGPRSNDSAPKKIRSAWADWWKAAEPTFDVAKRFERPGRPGLHLVVESAERRVAVIGSDGSTYWKLDHVPGLIDAGPAGDGISVLTRDGKGGSSLALIDWRGETVFSHAHPVELRTVARQADGTWLAGYPTDPRVTTPRGYAVALDRAGVLTAVNQLPPEVENW